MSGNRDFKVAIQAELQKAYQKGRVDVVEQLIEGMEGALKMARTDGDKRTLGWAKEMLELARERITNPTEEDQQDQEDRRPWI